MNGQELKEKLQEMNIVLTDVANGLNISTQALNSKLKASDIGVSFIKDIARVINKNVYELINAEPPESEKANKNDYLLKRREQKLLQNTTHNKFIETSRIPIFDIPIDASFLERYNDDGPYYEPIGFLDIPRLRNCNFIARVTGNSMYPILKSSGYVACRIVQDFSYFEEGEMYFVSTRNGFETVKYVQTGDNPDELKLIPHNEKIKASVIKKEIVLKMCIVEAWINFR